MNVMVVKFNKLILYQPALRESLQNNHNYKLITGNTAVSIDFIPRVVVSFSLYYIV